MNRLVRAALRGTGFTALATVCFVVAAPATIDSARWWRSPRIAGELRLSPSQVEALDRIYDRMTADAGRCASRTTRARREAERLLADNASQELLDVAAMALADAESEHRLTRTVGLYQMFRVLSSDQRAKLIRLVSTKRQATDVP